MKNLFVLLFCCALALPLRAAPKAKAPITEITLEEFPGRVLNPRVNKIVLYSNGTVLWLSGPYDKPERHRGHFYGFEQMVALFEKRQFWTFKENYDFVPDTGTIVMSAIRGGKRKTVSYGDFNGTTPLEVWGLEMAVRGAWSEVEWETPAPATPAPKATPTPTPQPIPIIRGGKSNPSP